MAKEFVFYVTEDGELTTLGQVVEFINRCNDDSVRQPVSQSVLDAISDAMAAGGIYPTLAGSWFYTGNNGEFIQVQAKGALRTLHDASIQLELDRMSILEDLKPYSAYLSDIAPETYAEAISLLRRLPKNALSVLFGIENKPPVSVSEKISSKGNAKSKVVMSEADREAIAARIVEAIKQGKFPATPSKPELLKEYDFDIRLNGKYDYVSTSKANSVYSELFAGDEILASEKGEKPNDNRKKKMMSEGMDKVYFERAKVRLGL